MKTFWVLLFIFSSSFVSLCGQDVKKVRIEVRGEDGNLKTVYESEDLESIKDLKTCLKGRPAPSFKCGYTGKIYFTQKDGTETNAEFNIKSCNHIVFMKGDRLISRYLKKSAIELLKKLTKT